MEPEWPKSTSKCEKSTRRGAIAALECKSGSHRATAEAGRQGAQESPRGEWKRGREGEPLSSGVYVARVESGVDESHWSHRACPVCDEDHIHNHDYQVSGLGIQSHRKVAEGLYVKRQKRGKPGSLPSSLAKGSSPQRSRWPENLGC
jgi:hypothetical protein